MIMRASCLMVLAAVALPLGAQSLAGRVAAERNGTVMFQFAARAGVCGDGYSFIRHGRTFFGSYSDANRYGDCTTGPVLVRLTLSDGVVERVQTWVGPVRAHDAKSIGVVPAREAADYLLSIAMQVNGRTGSNALLPAILADSAVVWPQLLRIARDSETRSRSLRIDAMHWLSRFAAGATTGRPNTPWIDDGDDEYDKIKENAVFVLSQMRDDTRIPALIDVARKNADAHVRGSALFWLGQTGDSRAIDLFESILRG
ncbi:MAG: lyase domain protein repeat-containing protein [Gemmatimonadetes bacterium]|nr:lyase domain protein repeat-containing protein [Gemmatimonadota bacterium]